MMLPALAAAIAAGPPYPPPQNDVTVYDYAEHPLARDRGTARRQIIAAIEQRTGAEVVVYTQYKPGSDEESTDVDAKALIDQWGVGRAGFFDGLVILWNMNRQQCLPGVSGNGQVQLYAGDGYKAAYLSNQERQAIFDDDMKPLLVGVRLRWRDASRRSTRSTRTPRPSIANTLDTARIGRRRRGPCRRAAAARPARRLGELVVAALRHATRSTSTTRRS